MQYTLHNNEIKKVNEKCDLRIGFDDSSKPLNDILLLYRWTMEGLAGWVEISFQRRQMFKNIYKTLQNSQIEYSTQDWASVSRSRN